jgi:hypothetical protein
VHDQSATPFDDHQHGENIIYEEDSEVITGEDLGAVVYQMFAPDYELSAEDVYSILRNVDGRMLATHPPIAPEGGHLYVFDISSNPKELRRMCLLFVSDTIMLLCVFRTLST